MLSGGERARSASRPMTASKRYGCTFSLSVKMKNAWAFLRSQKRPTVSNAERERESVWVLIVCGCGECVLVRVGGRSAFATKLSVHCCRIWLFNSHQNILIYLVGISINFPDCLKPSVFCATVAVPASARLLLAA